MLARRLFTSDDGALYVKLAEGTKVTLKNELLTARQGRGEPKIARKTCDLGVKSPPGGGEEAGADAVHVRCGARGQR